MERKVYQRREQRSQSADQKERTDVRKGVAMRKVKKVRFMDSSVIVKSLLEGIADRALTLGTKNSPIHDIPTRKPGTPKNGIQRLTRVTSLGNEKLLAKESVVDFPQTIYDLTSEVHYYGLHYCRLFVNKRHKHYLSLQLRCLKYV